MSLSVGGGRVGTLVLAYIITIFGYTNNVWLILFFLFFFLSFHYDPSFDWREKICLKGEGAGYAESVICYMLLVHSKNIKK